MALTAVVGLAGPAQAATTLCFSHGYISQWDEDATYVWHGETGYWHTWGGGAPLQQKSYGATDGWSYKWEKETWKGPVFRCPVGNTCDYAWAQTHSVTDGWVINAQLGGTVGNGKNSGNLNFIPSYGRNWTNSTAFTFTVHLLSGQYAQPYMAGQYQKQWGRTVGSWVHHGSAAERCNGMSAMGWMARAYKATWMPTWTSAWWNADVYQYPVSSYYTWY